MESRAAAGAATDTARREAIAGKQAADGKARADAAFAASPVGQAGVYLFCAA